MNVKKIERSIKFANMSVYTNFIMAAGKLILGIFTASTFLCINAFYNVGMAMAKVIAVNGYQLANKQPDEEYPHGYGREEYLCYYNVGSILTITSVIFILYCLRLFIHGSNAYYPQVVAIAIAAINFTEIAMAVQGTIVTRRGEEPVISAIKLTNLASSMISLVLTQTAILSFSSGKDLSFYNGISGVIFGSCAVLIGIYMMLHMSRIMNSKNYHSIIKRLQKVVRKSGTNIVLKPLKYEDYGSNARFLYVEFIEGHSKENYEKLKDEVKCIMNIELIRASSIQSNLINNEYNTYIK
ncbi:cation transporter [Clostridium sp.]|uniref:cation transporter n=1 Tax=Clostridium sp. TaxID=1506 RepID=UPI00258725B0|nr:cation transporter [Clostridium sp.]MDF2505482.1 hypothetical protein [Clostridium sp.]